jgi:hypothetical protein
LKYFPSSVTAITKPIESARYIHHQTGYAELDMPTVDAVAYTWGGMTS